MIDLYDKSIKTMKMSQEIPNTEKAKLFKKMLISYFDFLTECRTSYLKPDARSADQMKRLEETLLKLPETVTQLYPSPGSML